jgi:hypothetical protein
MPSRLLERTLAPASAHAQPSAGAARRKRVAARACRRRTFCMRVLTMSSGKMTLVPIMPAMPPTRSFAGSGTFGSAAGAACGRGRG